MFYNFPIFVPEVRESYTDWKKDFDKQVGNAIDCIVEKAEMEKKRAKEIKEYMDAFSKRES